MKTNPLRRNSAVLEALLFAGRLLTVWRREPMVSIQALLYPSFLLITFNLLLGKSVVRITGTDSLYGLVPICAIAGAMFGAFSASFTVQNERDTGLLGRVWVLPVNRISPLAGRLVADAVRTLISVLVITAVGVVLGLRFERGWTAIVAFVLVPVIVGTVFSMAVTAIAVRTTNSTALVWLMVPSLGAVFSSPGIAPIERLPAWIRHLSQLNPFTPAIESMRALAVGTPASSPLLVTLFWSLGLAAVAGPLAVRGYRAAAALGR